MNAPSCPRCGAPLTESPYCGACGVELGGETRLLPGRTTTTAATAPLALGSVPAGRFRIDEVLAVGSMGTVYRAADLQEREAPRALKELPALWGSADEREEAVTWFAREGDTLRGLDHPAIPRIYETFSVGPRHYLVMDLIEGETLEQIMASSGAHGLPEDQVVGWADQVLDVLSYLHARPIPLIFRDMKPANLMRTPQDRIRLIDFGIARLFARRTQGTAIGTPGYAPPEQYQGLAEPASDLYALGATMHHLLTGRDPRHERLFDFPPVRTLVPRLSSQTAGAIDRALILDPRHRFDTAADMHRALHAGTPLTSLPRLTQGGRAPTSSTVTLPLPAEARVEVRVVPSGDPGPGHSVRLSRESERLTHGGITLVASADRQRIELHNHTDERLACLLTCQVPWFIGSAETAWVEPHGMVEFALIAAPNGVFPIGGPAGDADSRSPAVVGPGDPIEGFTLQLHVEGVDLGERLARLTIMPDLVPLSIVAVSSALAVLIVAFAHLGILAFYALEIPALALAVRLQWRRRKRPTSP